MPESRFFHCMVPVLLLLTLPLCRKEGHQGRVFHEGRKLVLAGKYGEALPVLTDYLERFPAGRHASRARFFLAKAHLGQGDLPAARAAFESILREHPDSAEAHKARYKLALIDLLQGNRTAALRAFRAMADRPDGPLAPEAAALARYLEGR